MTTGLPDWYKGISVLPTVACYGWLDEGEGKCTDFSYGNFATIEHVVRENLGGVDVFFHSFSIRGHMSWIRGVDNVHTYVGNIIGSIEFYNPAGDAIGEVVELQTPVIIKNVDKMTTRIFITADRVASSADPAYYHFFVGFQCAYSIV